MEACFCHEKKKIKIKKEIMNFYLTIRTLELYSQFAKVYILEFYGKKSRIAR